MKISLIRTAVLAAALIGISASAFAEGTMLAERHVARGMKCENCHQTQPPKNDVKCETCHGSIEKVAAKTDKGDINPHASHVEGAQCKECHRGHKPPQLLCDQCHEFTQIKVP